MLWCVMSVWLFALFLDCNGVSCCMVRFGYGWYCVSLLLLLCVFVSAVALGAVRVRIVLR